MSLTADAPTELTYRVDGIKHTAEIPPDAVLDITHPAVREAARRIKAQQKARERAREEEKAAEAKRRKNRRVQKKLPAQPATGKWKAISTGAYKRRMRPQTSPEDRLFVPAAFEHWRKVHGLSRREAQARIGYSASSSSWAHWENGFVIPPYGTLLRILAATGLGYWVDAEHRAGHDPALRLDIDRAQWAANMRKRKRERQRRKPADAG